MIRKDYQKVGDNLLQGKINGLAGNKENNYGKIIKIKPQKTHENNSPCVPSKKMSISSSKNNIQQKVKYHLPLSDFAHSNLNDQNKKKALSKILSKHYEEKHEQPIYFNKSVFLLSINTYEQSNTKELETPKFVMSKEIHKGIDKKINFQGKILKVPKNKEDFIKNMKKQIKLQEKLRNLKHQISPKQKQKCLSQIQKMYGITSDIITLQPQEYDPFFKHQSHNSNITYITQQLVDTYLLIQKHWQQKMKQKYNKTTIQQFLNGSEPQNELLTLKRLAKYIQNYFGNEYIIRNKDIYAIYMRIKPCTRNNIIRQFTLSSIYDQQ